MPRCVNFMSFHLRALFWSHLVSQRRTQKDDQKQRRHTKWQSQKRTVKQSQNLLFHVWRCISQTTANDLTHECSIVQYAASTGSCYDVIISWQRILTVVIKTKMKDYWRWQAVTCARPVEVLISRQCYEMVIFIMDK